MLNPLRRSLDARVVVSRGFSYFASSLVGVVVVRATFSWSANVVQAGRGPREDFWECEALYAGVDRLVAEIFLSPATRA